MMTRKTTAPTKNLFRKSFQEKYRDKSKANVADFFPFPTPPLLKDLATFFARGV